jgi:tRNA-dihydrouridine synthase B
MSSVLLSSPLQGFTDYRFRNAFQKYFGGIDTYYAPYIRLNGKLEIKPVYDRDLQLKNNQTLEVIPQIMTNDADEFLFVAKYVKKLGYKELNWNLGCPYPMVINRKMGSGLIEDPQRIENILKKVHDKSDIIVSMKMRLGYNTPEEILDVFPVLDKFPIKNVAIHARIGKQLYKGGVDLPSFRNCLDKTKHKLYYNGDINSVAEYRRRVEEFPEIDHWMIGRGLIADPFLPSMIKSNTEAYPKDRFDRLEMFQAELYAEFENGLSGTKAVHQKMMSYWEYFTEKLEDPNFILRKVKKAKTKEEYDMAVHDYLQFQK